MLSQDEVYGWLLTKFFDSHDYPQLAWIHDLAIGRYAHAADSLNKVEATEEDLAQKHVSFPLSSPRIL
jgi:nuclear pore complex protein Nup133